MKSEWTKAPNGSVRPTSVRAGAKWPLWRSSFTEMLAEFGEYALAAIIIMAFISWLAFMPSIGFLWLVGWL